MVKFSKELDAQLIPEWREAFIDYRRLKKHVKRIKLASIPDSFDDVAPEATDGRRLRPLRCHITACIGFPSGEIDEECGGGVVSMAEPFGPATAEEEAEEFMGRLAEELEKVNCFYKKKEKEFCERGEALGKHLQVLLDIKKVLLHHHHHHCTIFRRCFSVISPDSGDDRPSTTPEPPVVDEAVLVLEAHGVSSTSTDATPWGKTPAVVWEKLVGTGGSDRRRQVKLAEKATRRAYIELYKDLELLIQYSSLNLVAFRKILKKFDKVLSHHRATESFKKLVWCSHFVTSDKIVRLADEVECVFVKNFAGNDKNKAMKFLMPTGGGGHPKESHVTTFFAGVFTGSLVALLLVYGMVGQLIGVFSPGTPGYMYRTYPYLQTVYPIFSVFALLSLHVFLYGCNLSMWRSTRIDHNSVFGFSVATSLKPCDAFLISACLMTAAATAIVIHLVVGAFSAGSDFLLIGRFADIPGVLLALLFGLLIMPLDVCYRSTRITFLRLLRNTVLSPCYKVLMVDFFLADQLTSQVHLLRHLESTTCYFVATKLKYDDPYISCISSPQATSLTYIFSFLPYFWRTLQCARRYVEEGRRDPSHLANCGKYLSAVAAALARMKYSSDPSPGWAAAAGTASAAATIYQMYWDFVKDWGVLRFSSRNRMLRDKLVLKTKTIYYASIVINLVLRVACVESMLSLRLSPVENMIVDFLMASLEIVRRGLWNFYRMENEHLINIAEKSGEAADRGCGAAVVPTPEGEIRRVVATAVVGDMP